MPTKESVDQGVKRFEAHAERVEAGSKRMESRGKALKGHVETIGNVHTAINTGIGLKGVFNEAKNAYEERKAEIMAERKKKEDARLRRSIKAMNRTGKKAQQPGASVSSDHDTKDSDSLSGYTHAEANQLTRYSQTQQLRDSVSTLGPPRITNGQIDTSRKLQSRSAPVSPVEAIRRAKTELELSHRPKLRRSRSNPEIDMDLAYGEFHVGDLKALMRRQKAQQKQLGELVHKCQALLDEADCASQSVRKIIKQLAKKPELLSGVAVTLTEISKLAAQMAATAPKLAAQAAPAALAAYQASTPAVLALLASPQFLIAVGVGVGVTVIMFGGYKIVKKIQADADNSEDELAYGVEMDEALDVNELNRIEKWRRGIANVFADDDDDVQTVASAYSATSVEGEYITPFAAWSMGHLPLKKYRDRKNKKESEKEEKGKDEKDKSDKEKKEKDKKDKKDKKKDKEKEKEKKEKKKSSKDKSEDVTEDESGSVSSGNGVKLLTAPEQPPIKVRKPSPLRKMFAHGTSAKS